MVNKDTTISMISKIFYGLGVDLSDDEVIGVSLNILASIMITALNDKYADEVLSGYTDPDKVKGIRNYCETMKKMTIDIVGNVDDTIEYVEFLKDRNSIYDINLSGGVSYEV